MNRGQFNQLGYVQGTRFFFACFVLLAFYYVKVINLFFATKRKEEHAGKTRHRIDLPTIYNR